MSHTVKPKTMPYQINQFIMWKNETERNKKWKESNKKTESKTKITNNWTWMQRRKNSISSSSSKWFLIEQENGLSWENNFRYAVTNFNRSIANWLCVVYDDGDNYNNAQSFSVSLAYTICTIPFLAHIIESHLSCLHTHT